MVNIGAPFWGIVFGTAASFLFERTDFQASIRSTTEQNATSRENQDGQRAD